MALDLKISFEGADSSGRVLNFKDVTGSYDPSNNLGGWGSPNPSPASINKLIITISKIDDKKLYRQDLTSDIYNFNDITSGNELISISSISLGITNAYQPVEAFKDGVYDVNYYAVFGEVTGITATAGSTYISGANMNVYYDYDSLLINDELYTIDHTQAPYGNLNLALVEPLKSNATSFRPVLRANTKAMIDVNLETLLMINAGRVADACHLGSQVEVDAGVKALYMGLASKIAFEDYNYAQADSLLKGANYTLSKVMGGLW